MELVCNTKFWLFPASHFAQNKRLYFYMDDKLVYDLVFPLDYDNPEYEFPLNVERFQGKNSNRMQRRYGGSDKRIQYKK